MARAKSTIQWGDESRLLAVATRLREVKIEHDDAFAVIRRFDGPDTLFYCDPPYVHSTRTGSSEYKYEMENGQHQEFLRLVNSIEGKVVISCYASELYAKALPAKRWRRVERMARTRNTKAEGNRLEVLYIKK